MGLSGGRVGKIALPSSSLGGEMELEYEDNGGPFDLNASLQKFM